jgi:hypothetical protein
MIVLSMSPASLSDSATEAEKTVYDAGMATMWRVQVVPLLYSVFLILNSLILVGIYRFVWKNKKD